MASISNDNVKDDLLNDNVHEQDELPSGDEQEAVAERLFGEENEEDGAAAVDGEQAVKVEPKKRSVRNPRSRLTAETLRGPRGIQTIEDYFKDIKFKGKGYEKQDLDEVMRRLQHWGHRMYANYKFDDVLNNIERLGKKKPLQVHMSRYRLGMLENLRTEDIVQDDDDDGVGGGAGIDEPFDEFDALLGEQIAISKIAPRTPATNSRYAANTNSAMAVGTSKTPYTSNSAFTTPSFSRGNAVMSTPYSDVHNLHDDSELARPLPPSQPSTPKQLTSEQLERMAENKRLAQERLRAKKMQLDQAQQERLQLQTIEAQK